MSSACRQQSANLESPGFIRGAWQHTEEETVKNYDGNITTNRNSNLNILFDKEPNIKG